MKKQVLLSLVLLCSTLLIHAQWNGTNPVWTSSNVGINTDSPQSKLHISDGNNNIRMGDLGSSTAGIELTDGPINSSSSVYLFGWGNSFRIGIGSPNETNHLFTISNTGLVGIGTTTPESNLHIKYTTNTQQAYLRLESSNTGQNASIQYVSGGVFRWELGTGISSGTNFELYDRVNNKAHFVVTPEGRMGIGTTNTEDATLKIYKSTYPVLMVADDNTKFRISIAKNGWDWAPGTLPGDVAFVSNGSHNMFFCMNDNNNDGNSYIKFGDWANGSWVGIFNNRVFRVDGKMIAKELQILSNVWADDVFRKDYRLMPLKELENYINEHKHLPGVPSEQEVKANGIDIPQTNAMLLRKIEELTLFTIEQNKKLEQLEEQNKEIQLLKEEIEKLKTAYK